MYYHVLELYIVYYCILYFLNYVQLAVNYNLVQTNESPDIDLEVHSEVKDDGTVSIEICAMLVYCLIL